MDEYPFILYNSLCIKNELENPFEKLSEENNVLKVKCGVLVFIESIFLK